MSNLVENSKKTKSKDVIFGIVIFILILWAIYIIDLVIPYNFSQLGIVPRSISGLKGILLSPFIHGSYSHLASNSVPIAVLLFFLFTLYKRDSIKIIALITIIGGGFVWIFARSASHIGISGLIYGLVTFLIVAGIFKRDFKSIAVSIVTAVLYGGILWGVLPTSTYISWEGHLFGAIAGGLIAYKLTSKK